MFKCQFIYRLASGGNSDSLDFKVDVEVVPRVGDMVSFVGADGSFAPMAEVKEVVHYISRHGAPQEVVIYYGD